MNKLSVREVMGEYTLLFFQVDAMRANYKFLRDKRGPQAWSKMRAQTWHTAKKQMPEGVHYFCVAVKTIPAKSESGASFNIIGVLSCYDNYDDAEAVSKMWYTKHKFLETDKEKLDWTRQFITDLKEWHNDDGDFATSTYDTFMELTK